MGRAKVERYGAELLKLLRESLPAADSAPPVDGPADPLAERLRAWRRERAEADGVAAFVVFGDRVLYDIVEARPRTAALLEVRGMGPVKVERYGAEVLKLIRESPPP